MSGWQRVAFRDLGTWFGGGTPSKSRSEFWVNGTIPWLSPKDMGTDVLHSTLDHITEAAVAGSAVRVVPGPSVAVVVRSGILERTVPIALVPFETTLNQDMKAVVARDGVDPRWIAWGLRALERDLLAGARKAGTTVASLEMPRFLDFTLPVPPLAEQRRIVDILEDHLSRLDAADRSIDSAERRLDVLRASARRQALMEGSGPSMRIDEVAVVGTGSTPRRSRADYFTGPTPWVTSGDLRAGLITEVPQRVSDQAIADARLRKWPPGTLLLAMYGEGKTRGTVAELGVEATINQACAAIVPNSNDEVIRRWMRLALEDQYDSMRRQSSGGVQPNLNLSIVKSLEMAWPDRSAMVTALERYSEITRGTVRVAPQLAAAQRRSASLRRALLAAAFSGRLTGAASDLDRVEELAATR